MVAIDPENPVVKLCAQGMEYESKGNFEAAAMAFRSAWEQSTDDYERCISAHYLARHQQNPDEALLWNQRSLDHALAVDERAVEEFLPSLYLNLGKACEDLDNREEARRCYAKAAQIVNTLPDNSYGGTVRGAIERALQRVSP